MKKIIIALATVSFVGLSITGCPSPNAANSSNPYLSTNPGTGTGTGNGNTYANKASFTAYLNCVKVKFPQAAASIDLQINALNSISDAQWAAVSANYEAIGKAYAALGC